MNDLVHFVTRANHHVAKSLKTPFQKVFTDSMVIVSCIVTVNSNTTNFAKRMCLFYGRVITAHTNVLKLNNKDSLYTVDFPVKNFDVTLGRKTNLLCGSSRNGCKLYMPTVIPNHWIDLIIFEQRNIKLYRTPLVVIVCVQDKWVDMHILKLDSFPTIITIVVTFYY